MPMTSPERGKNLAKERCKKHSGSASQDSPDDGSGLTGDPVRILGMSRGSSCGREDKGSTWFWFDWTREVIEALGEDEMQ